LAVFSQEGRDADRYIVSNYSYLDEARAEDKGSVNYFVCVLMIRHTVGGKSAGRSTSSSLTSGTPTRTFSEKTSGQSGQNSSFSTAFFIKTVVSAAFFTLLFLTANTMMQAFRERIPEFAVLKTVGFSDLTVFTIVLAEFNLTNRCRSRSRLTIAAFLMPLAKDTIGIAHIRPIVFYYGGVCAYLWRLSAAWFPDGAPNG